MEATMNIIKTLNDKNLLGQFLSDRKTWAAWFTFLRCFFGLKPMPKDAVLYESCTGRSHWPGVPLKEAWLIIGTRGGKSFITALIATYLAVFREYQLSAGEKGFIIIVAPTKKQARIIKAYLTSFFTDNPFLSPYLARESAEEVELSNNIIISVLSSDYRSLRGFTAIAAIVDELAYINIEGSKPDVEVIRALRSRLLSTGGPLICISSPYAKRGALYDTWKRHYGNDDSDILVWQASSALMNPTLNQTAIDRAMEEDPAGARTDYLAEFRSDIESYVTLEALEACVEPERHELPYNSQYIYQAFVDPSGGARDSMTLAISHFEDEVRVLDLVRERKPPFSPDAVVEDFAAVLKEYKLHEVKGDRYSGEWCRERFSVHGVNYKVADMPKSDYYRELLPLINSQRVALLDNSKMINQIVNLERRTGRGGKDSIDHPPNGHDDIANAAAGALVSLQDFEDIEIEGYGESIAGQMLADPCLLHYGRE